MGGAMSWVSERNLVAAISNAGGFGVIACGAMTVDLLDREIAATKALTDRPFGVNLITMHPDLFALIEVCGRHAVGHVVLAGGLPPKGALEAIKATGAKVICFAPALSLAKKLIRSGVDALVVEGMEAGGHIGPVSTSVLAQEILPEVADQVPVFVAGGIGRGELVLIVGYTSDGKTSCCVQLAWSAAVEQKKNVVFLTADAYGVLPPISRLSAEQTMYQFISGFTAKIPGTEDGVTEPSPTFSTCFGAPFMPRHPGEYARLLAQKVQESGARVWLVNTGWSGGMYGQGKRMSIAHTRAMINAALSGALDDVPFEKEGFFDLEIPTQVPGVPEGVLNPRDAWSDKAAYDQTARKLARMFRENFKRFEDGVDEAVTNSIPNPDAN